MKGVMMNELESAIVEWVTKNDKHGRAVIGEAFINKGYPYNDIENAMDRLLKDGPLYLNDHYVCFAFPEDHDGFGSQLLNHVSDENKQLRDLIVPKYIQEALAANEQAAEAQKPGQPLVVVGQNPAVHSPSHYTRGGIETIDFIEAKGLNFHLGNVVKYVSRAGFKQDALIQDLEKALWYLNREIKRIKTQEP